MSTSQTSAAFDFWRQLYASLASTTWPAHAATGQGPLVIAGDISSRMAELRREFVAVAGFASPAQQQWAMIGQRKRDEEFALRVRVVTAVPGVEADDVLARLEELVNVVELLIRPTTTSTVGQLTLNVTNVWQAAVVEYEAEIAPNTEGYEGDATLVIGVRARL